VTTTTEHATHPEAQHGHAPPVRRGILMRPGFVRAAWCAGLFFLLGMFLVVGIRALAGWDPTYDWTIIVLVGALTAAPIGFLLGLGAFDYWLYYLSGRPTWPSRA
jgi:hypothetical protein